MMNVGEENDKYLAQEYLYRNVYYMYRNIYIISLLSSLTEVYKTSHLTTLTYIFKC